MKKLILLVALTVTSAAVFAQNPLKKFSLSIGIDGASPLSDLKETTKLGLGGTATIGYHFTKTIALTFQTGFIAFEGEQTETENGKYKMPKVNFIPLKLGGRVTFLKLLYVEPQMGLTTFNIKDYKSSSGFTYAINAGVSLAHMIDISTRYEGISNDRSINFLGVRAAYSFGF